MKLIEFSDYKLVFRIIFLSSFDSIYYSSVGLEQECRIGKKNT